MPFLFSFRFGCKLIRHRILGLQTTPLLHAVITGNQQVVERLLQYKADVLHVVRHHDTSVMKHISTTVTVLHTCGS